MTDQNLLAIIMDRTKDQRFSKYFERLKKETGFAQTEIQGALIKIGLNAVLASRINNDTSLSGIITPENLSMLGKNLPESKFHKIPKEIIKALQNTIYNQ